MEVKNFTPNKKNVNNIDDLRRKIVIVKIRAAELIWIIWATGQYHLGSLEGEISKNICVDSLSISDLKQNFIVLWISLQKVKRKLKKEFVGSEICTQIWFNTLKFSTVFLNIDIFKKEN